MKNETIPDLTEISKTIRNTFQELHEGIKASKLSTKESENVLLELENGMFKAYQFKVDMKMRELESTSPEMPVRDVLINLLKLLRPETSARVTAMVTAYIFQEWEKRTLKIAA